MKRRKDEEKTMGPLFPRLHVNDANKGGPRAPPRNKMALYEQLSIPSQRYSHGVLPPVPFSSQGVSNERDVLFSYSKPAKHQNENQYGQFSDLSTPSTPVKKRKKLDEDDFRVPIFMHSVPSQKCGRFSKPSNFNEPLALQKSTNLGMLASRAMQEGNMLNKENSEALAMDQVKDISNPSSIEKTENMKKQNDSPACHGVRDNCTNNIDRSATHTDTALCSEMRAASERHGAVPPEDHAILHELCSDTESHENGVCGLERGDSSVTETSVVDSVSRVDVTPDDVVAIIGEKHFWKARRAIANQQRVFKIQVFELHRLIKVQKLLAASPHLLLAGSASSDKSMKALPAKRMPSNPPVKEIPNVSMQKGEQEKPSQKKESAAENTIGKSSFSSIQNGVSPKPSNDNSPAPSMNSMWCFNQPSGQHWLIPVMSPTEGLIYKPYPDPACGSNLAMGNLFPSAFAFPAPHPSFQMAPYPGSTPHCYFPHYTMPVMNPSAYSASSVEQPNRPTGNQNTSTAPSNKNQASLDNPNNLVASEGIDVQASTGSSLCNRIQDRRVSNSTEVINSLPLFCRDTTCSSHSNRPEPEHPHPAQVIKVVPHNARSTTESAARIARIFQSIQEGRRQ